MYQETGLANRGNYNKALMQKESALEVEVEAGWKGGI